MRIGRDILIEYTILITGRYVGRQIIIARFMEISHTNNCENARRSRFTNPDVPCRFNPRFESIPIFVVVDELNVYILTCGKKFPSAFNDI